VSPTLPAPPSSDDAFASGFRPDPQRGRKVTLAAASADQDLRSGAGVNRNSGFSLPPLPPPVPSRGRTRFTPPVTTESIFAFRAKKPTTTPPPRITTTPPPVVTDSGDVDNFDLEDFQDSGFQQDLEFTPVNPSDTSRGQSRSRKIKQPQQIATADVRKKTGSSRKKTIASRTRSQSARSGASIFRKPDEPEETEDKEITVAEGGLNPPEEAIDDKAAKIIPPLPPLPSSLLPEGERESDPALQSEPEADSSFQPILDLEPESPPTTEPITEREPKVPQSIADEEPESNPVTQPQLIEDLGTIPDGNEEAVSDESAQVIPEEKPEVPTSPQPVPESKTEAIPDSESILIADSEAGSIQQPETIPDSEPIPEQEREVTADSEPVAIDQPEAIPDSEQTPAEKPETISVPQPIPVVGRNASGQSGSTNLADVVFVPNLDPLGQSDSRTPESRIPDRQSKAIDTNSGKVSIQQLNNKAADASAESSIDELDRFQSELSSKHLTGNFNIDRSQPTPPPVAKPTFQRTRRPLDFLQTTSTTASPLTTTTTAALKPTTLSLFEKLLLRSNAADVASLLPVNFDAPTTSATPAAKQTDIISFLPPGFRNRRPDDFVAPTTSDPLEKFIVKNDDVSGFLPPGFRIPAGPEIPATTVALSSKIKPAPTISGFLPPGFRNPNPSGDSDEATTTAAPLTSPIDKLIVRQDDISAFLPPGFKLPEAPEGPAVQSTEASAPTKSPLDKFLIKQDDISAFLPPGFKLPEEPEGPKIQTSATVKPPQSKPFKQTNISGFLPPGFRVQPPDDSRIPEPSTTTSAPSPLDKFLIKQEDISAFLPPGYKPPAPEVTEVEAAAAPPKSPLDKFLFKQQDLSAFLPPGYKPPEPEVSEATPVTKSPLDKFLIKQEDISAFLPPGFKMPEPEATDVAATTSPAPVTSSTGRSGLVFPTRAQGGPTRVTTPTPKVFQRTTNAVHIKSGWPVRSVSFAYY